MFRNLSSSIRTGAFVSALPVVLLLCVQISRADGLPGEYLVTQRWRTLLSQHSPLTNPAFLTEANYIEGRFAGSRTLQEFGMLEAGVSIPVRLYQTFGASFLYQGSDPFYETGGDPADAFRQGVRQIRDYRTQTMLSYAVNPWNRLSLGLNVNIAYESLFADGDNRAGVGVDLGLSYRLLRHQLFGDHLGGVAFQNVLPVSFKAAADDLPGDNYPSVLRLSLLSSFWERQISTAFDFSIKDLYAQAQDFQGGDKNFEWDLNARLGIWFLRLFKIYALCGFDGTDTFKYWGFSPAFNIPAVLTGHELEVAYQFVAIREGDATTNSFYIRGEIGRHREEIFARRMARLASIEPNDLYNRALTLYSRGMFWDAFFIFGKIQVEYPDFFKRDWVDYYMGACQEKMDMRTSAMQRYDQVRKDFAKSAVKPHADLGMLRVEYRNDNNAVVRAMFNELNQPGVPDSLKFHAFYYKGQSLMNQGEHLKAIQLLERLPEYHPDYIFAQHSLAVCKATTSSLETALPHLENAIMSVPPTKAHEEVINRSIVLIGYIFYESLGEIDGALSRAVTAFRRVPESSRYHEDALLGMGWTALKARQWQDTYDAGNTLLNRSKHGGLRAEGGLLMAYAEIMRERHASAITILEQAARNVAGYHAATKDSLVMRKQENEATRVRYRSIAEVANDLAANRQSSHVLRQIDSASVHQVSTKREIDSYLTFLDENYRNLFFARTLDQVSEDIQYALAQSQRMIATRKTTQDVQKMQTQQQQIEDEIERLESEMRKMDEQQKLEGDTTE